MSGVGGNVVYKDHFCWGSKNV